MGGGGGVRWGDIEGGARSERGGVLPGRNLLMKERKNI